MQGVDKKHLKSAGTSRKSKIHDDPLHHWKERYGHEYFFKVNVKTFENLECTLDKVAKVIEEL